MAKSPSASSQQKFILDMIKEWSNRLKLSEWKIIVLFAREKDNFEIDGHEVYLGMTQLHRFGDKHDLTTSYRVKLAFREIYYPEDWEEYDSFYHMAETTVMHELLHIKVSKCLHAFRHLIPADTEDKIIDSGQRLQEEEWLVDNLARTMYDLKYGDA